MKPVLLACLVAATVFIALPTAIAAPVAKEIYFTKQIPGVTIPGSYTFTFSLFDGQTSGTRLWTESKRIRLTSRTLKHYLGSVVPGSLDAVDFSQQLWVQVDRLVGGLPRTIGARTRLNLQPYAAWGESATNADQVDGMHLSDLAASYVDVGEPSSITSLMIVNGSVLSEDLADGAALAEIADDDGSGSGLDADRLDGRDSSRFWTLDGNYGTTVNDFLGTMDEQPLVLRVNGTPALRLEPALVGGVPGGTPNLAGGLGNSFGMDVEASAVGGGGDNRIWDSFGFIGGGSSNRVGVDDGGDMMQTHALVAGGYQNSAANEFAAVSGGWGNLSSGRLSAVGGGNDNVAAGECSAVAGGRGARADHYGEMAHSSGSFSGVAGEAQGSLYVLNLETPDQAWRTLFLGGLSVAEQITVPPGRTMLFDILVVGRDNQGNSNGYAFKGMVENVGGTMALVGSLQKTEVAEDLPACDATVQADDALDALVVRVQGAAGYNIRWVATVRTVEVQGGN